MKHLISVFIFYIDSMFKSKKKKEQELRDKINSFMADYKALCEKHGMELRTKLLYTDGGVSNNWYIHQFTQEEIKIAKK